MAKTPAAIARRVKVTVYHTQAVVRLVDGVFRGWQLTSMQELIDSHAKNLGQLNRLLSYLTQREREAVVLYFGLDEDKKRTQAKTAKLMGISVSRVKALLHAARGKLVTVMKP